MSEEAKSRVERLLTELDNLKMALQTAAGGTDPQVQEIITRMEEILTPSS